VFVDDKKLAAFLNAAAGLVASMSAPLPVVNAVAKNGELKAASSGSIPQMFYNELKRKKIREFTPKEAQNILKTLGASDGSYNYVCKLLKEHKQAKLISRGRWKVL
jgi:hypothetical protein